MIQWTERLVEAERLEEDGGEVSDLLFNPVGVYQSARTPHKSVDILKVDPR